MLALFFAQDVSNMLSWFQAYIFDRFFNPGSFLDPFLDVFGPFLECISVPSFLDRFGKGFGMHVLSEVQMFHNAESLKKVDFALAITVFREGRTFQNADRNNR